jgi:hypothetical protein
LCAYHRILPPHRPGPATEARLSEVPLAGTATAVRLGRYLDVEITLVHGGRMVMRGAGPVISCSEG